MGVGGVLSAAALQRSAQRALTGAARILAGQPIPETHPEVSVVYTNKSMAD